ncbi:hypothetical protein HPG69_003768 [Diceros bicornis minor]|uniref:Uncharacterized protein n=1 Tax=Diceros bicornis minor TaxID=77932 RepID=A0A7J7ETK7_DICBM|nr:hypothetical protein HPG69_003768 [Diceros bicornis minor]
MVLYKTLFADHKVFPQTILNQVMEANKVLGAYDFESLAQNMKRYKHPLPSQYSVKDMKTLTLCNHLNFVLRYRITWNIYYEIIDIVKNIL